MVSLAACSVGVSAERGCGMLSSRDGSTGLMASTSFQMANLSTIFSLDCIKESNK